ncbi:MAG: WD40/YVTN/BNR-like repeat-containing protein [Vicinamibacterales bacterium]
MQIVDISPREDNTTRRLGRDFQSVSGKALCCALHPAGGRAYLGGHSGIWRSDDGGATWHHLEWPQPPGNVVTVPGALLGTTIYDLAVSPADPDLLLAAVGKDARMPTQVGIWRSADGGATWRRVHQFVQGTAVSQANCLSMATDDPGLVFAAGGTSLARSVDGGITWTTLPLPMLFQQVWYVAVAPARGAVRHVYALGTRLWHSADGGTTWRVDPQALAVGAQGDGAGAGARSLAVHPGSPTTVFVARFEPNTAINNVEGIVWRGTFTATGDGQWLRLPPLPLNYPSVTASGSGWVVPVLDAKTGGLVLVASDRRTVHLAEGEPADPAGWTRIEDPNCHLDPHGFAASAAFSRAGRAGRALLVNDGGPNISGDGARSWTNGRGVSSLGIVNAAVAPQTGTGAAICMGMGDNFGYASPDDGVTWETQHYLGGDNDCAFCDPRQPHKVLVFGPRDGKGDGGVGRGVVYLYATTADRAPDTSHGTSEVQRIPGAPPLPSKIIEALNSDDPGTALSLLTAAWSAVSFFYNVGYRPLVLTPEGESVPPDVDFVAIRFTDDLPELVRSTKVSRVTDAQFWETHATADGPDVRAFKVGPPLPAREIRVVQASGGHASPTFYVGDQRDRNSPTMVGLDRLWKWTAGMADWQPIVPAPGVGRGPQAAQRFFADPYRPNLVYVLGNDHVYRSTTGGATWQVDTALERALTENGAFPLVTPDDGNPAPALLRDMQFDPHQPGHRYAVGPAGVFQTLDGSRWTCLLRASASACRPMNLAYDFASCPRALYVSTSNRGLLKIAPLPPEWDFPIGSLQAAVGRITLLRVHDVGTGFGPPGDRLDGEVVVLLDSQPEKAFGFRLRTGADRPVAEGLLGLLRDAFNANRVVRLEFTRTGCRTAHIVRVVQQ